jgi:hypothetical protein
MRDENELVLFTVGEGEIRPSIDDTHLILAQCLSEVPHSFIADAVVAQIEVGECL